MNACRRSCRIPNELGGMQERFGGNATLVETHATQTWPVIHQQHLLAMIGRVEGRSVSARAGTDDDDVRLDRIHRSPSRRANYRVQSQDLRHSPEPNDRPCTPLSPDLAADREIAGERVEAEWQAAEKLEEWEWLMRVVQKQKWDDVPGAAVGACAPLMMAFDWGAPMVWTKQGKRAR